MTTQKCLTCNNEYQEPQDDQWFCPPCLKERKVRLAEKDKQMPRHIKPTLSFEERYKQELGSNAIFKVGRSM